ncbi:PIN domain-containing protein [Spirosoma spitsbergense]|uniref:PIN domain-containing protein n=1 Tax=Spirosoma spitsbergense TaxID=431554 RepID=UPI0003619429|nr:PIN domain-containing protein [Spirosoma spitsbergense]
MIYSTSPVALLDACILYPAPLRDLLFHIAVRGLYRPKWTDKIQEEWTRNLLLNRPDLLAAQLEKTTDAMNRAFPDAMIRNFESLITSLTLPDADDRHVLAAAIRGQADVLVTANLKDFPLAIVGLFDIEVQHPDQFISSFLATHPDEVLLAFKSQVGNLRRPAKTAAEVLEILRRNGLTTTVDTLRGLL